jgi:hypothetical protein
MHQRPQREDLTFFKGTRLSVTGVSLVVTMMKLASAVVLALAVLPSTVSGQVCPSLCTDGSDPGNLEAELPVPGVGNVSCEDAASLINTLPTITSDQCTTIQAAAFLICECRTTPQANVNLPCAFCADGSLPTNMDDPIEPTVPIPLTDGEIQRCGGLVALASTLSGSAEDMATCETIQSYATVCGCAAEGATGEPEEATTVVDEETTGATEPAGPGGPGEEEEATTVAVVPPTEPAEEETTVGGPGAEDDPLIPTSSPAPSLVEIVDSSMPTLSSSGTEMPVESGGSGVTEPPSPTSILTPFPTAEPTSAAAKSTVCGAVLGMLVAIIM